MKNKPIPKNPKSPKQDAIRRSLALANTSWTAMSQAARRSWELWGKTLVKYDRLGNKLVINGWSAFSGAFVLNTLSSLANTKLLLGAPTIGNYSSAKPVTVTPNEAGTRLVIKNTSNVSITIMVFRGRAVKPTINVNKWGYYYSETHVFTPGQDVELPFGVTKDTNNFVRLVAIDDTGRHSLHNDITAYVPK